MYPLIDGEMFNSTTLGLVVCREEDEGGGGIMYFGESQRVTKSGGTKTSGELF